jgi:hypothetical protein
MAKGRFSRFEQQIEQIVEGSLARLFAGRLHPREVATHLARVMEDSARTTPDGNLLAPNVYTVRLNPSDYEALISTQPDLVKTLSETIVDLAHRTEMRLASLPILSIEPDPVLPPRAIHVVAEHESATSRSTQMLQPVTAPPAIHSSRNPQVIVAGTRYVALDRPVINIGRRHDNHIVIDDMRVSRMHAQIRLRFGHYVLYDLGSSGGTFVNEHAITECILKPGDVISLAGVPLVYIEDESSTSDSLSATDTQIKRPSRAAEADSKDSDPTL